ncbi:MAG: aspartate/glutamate racemase family protein [Acetobacteraceae bacterium]|nr:aspartate/glutamate racemase family protein [Pseudomonadota bacterium]
MRILFANPNTTTAVTDRIAAVARGAASPGTEVVAVTAPYGVPYIATRAEAVIGGRVALELLAEHSPGCDAAVIAAFADPGIGGARELFPIPVIGMAEAAMLTACMLGRRFSIVTFATAMEPWYRECVDYNGLGGRLASIRCVPGGFRDINSVAEEKSDELVAACCAAVEQDQADVVILGGAPLAGLASVVAERVPVPLVDGVAAAMRQAEVLAALRPRKATAGTFRTPDAKPVTGVPAALERLFTRR